MAPIFLCKSLLARMNNTCEWAFFEIRKSIRPNLAGLLARDGWTGRNPRVESLNARQHGSSVASAVGRDLATGVFARSHGEATRTLDKWIEHFGTHSERLSSIQADPTSFFASCAPMKTCDSR